MKKATNKKATLRFLKTIATKLTASLQSPSKRDYRRWKDFLANS
jgi:hypothetical protein